LFIASVPAVVSDLSAFCREYVVLFCAPAFQLDIEGVQSGAGMRAGDALGQMGLDAVQNLAGADATREPVSRDAVAARAFDQVSDFEIESFFDMQRSVVHYDGT